jgi:hypothetical protein
MLAPKASGGNPPAGRSGRLGGIRGLRGSGLGGIVAWIELGCLARRSQSSDTAEARGPAAPLYGWQALRRTARPHGSLVELLCLAVRSSGGEEEEGGSRQGGGLDAQCPGA